MLKQRRETRLINCLICWTCGSRLGPNHFTLKDGGAVCSLCSAKNPLTNLRKLSLKEVREPIEIIIAFTQSGTYAHALHVDCRTVLGPWVQFQSAETLERALVYLGATEQEIAQFRTIMKQSGQGTAHFTLIPGRKNLLRIDWSKL